MKLFRYEQKIYERTVDNVCIQVVDRGEQRELRFGNAITQSARSLTAPDVLVLDYTRAMLVGLLFQPSPAQVLHLGLGGGSLPDFLHRHLPQVRQRVVEVNPGVVEIAYRYFELPLSPRLEVITEDGAQFLLQDAGRYDLIFLDAFHAGGPTPHMISQSCFRLLRERLNPGGWVVVNSWGSDRQQLQTTRSALRQEFRQLRHLSVRLDSNVIFVATSHDRAPSPAQLKRRVQWLSERLPLDFDNLLQRLQPPAPVAGARPPLDESRSLR